jgi:NAD(P)-dependent dehydrogenase (short-subunit alcohol dehydrogenase family)
MSDLIGYGASKFAVVGISECLRLDMAKHNVGVSVLCPGMVATALATSQRNRPGIDASAASTASSRPSPQRAALRHMEPREVGEMTADAVIANRPYILTHPEFREPIEARCRALIEAFGTAG